MSPDPLEPLMVPYQAQDGIVDARQKFLKGRCAADVIPVGAIGGRVDVWPPTKNVRSSKNDEKVRFEQLLASSIITPAQFRKILIFKK